MFVAMRIKFIKFVHETPNITQIDLEQWTIHIITASKRFWQRKTKLEPSFQNRWAVTLERFHDG